jgi:hypothetical protein
MMLKCAAALMAGGLLLGGCGGASNYSAPSSFTVSNAAVAAVVTQAVNHTASSPGLNGSPIVDCTGESSCYITYTVKKPVGTSNDIELLKTTRQIWKALFEDSKFQVATLEVDAPATSAVRSAGTRNTLFTLVCDRSAASQIDWSKVDGKGLKTLCHYTPPVSGM